MSKKTCCECGETYPCGGTSGFVGSTSRFLPVNNFLFGAYLPICNFCIERRVRQVYEENGDNYWNFLDQLCQLLNIQFNPSLWEKLSKVHKYKTFAVYANMMYKDEYATPDWNKLNKRYLELEAAKELDEEVPELREENLRKYREKWGFQYDEESLMYLEQLLSGLIKTQDVSGAKAYDEAKKLCKISLLIEERIRAGEDFDKLLKSYELLTKVADFTPKNARDVNDFNSVGELFSWLEKRGWVNRFYDGATRDVLDATMKNMQTYNRNLYVNETAIGEEIDRRLEALKSIQEFENQYYDDDKVDDYDVYEIEGYLEDIDDFEEDIR